MDDREEKIMRRMFGFLIGIFIGALVGSTVALLLAPESGEKMRADLRGRGEALLADVRVAAEMRRAELTDRLQSLRAPRTSSTELS
jgi:gas vesicle protein